MEKIVVGLDVGASSFKVVTRTPNGDYVIREPLTLVHNAAAGAEAFIGAVINGVAQATTGYQIAGLGSAIPGAADYAAGIMTNPTNFKGPGFVNFPFGPRLSEAIGAPVWTGNDADYAALAEAAHTGIKDLAFFTWGTGVGGGIVHKGKLLGSPWQCAAEFGHIPIEHTDSAPPCGCGSRGCLEALTSTTALVREIGESLDVAGDAVKRLWQNTPEDRRLRDLAPAIFELATSGDAFCRMVVLRMAKAMGLGAAIVANTTGPLRVAIGGGLMYPGAKLNIDGKNLLELVRETANPRLFGPMRGKADLLIVPAELGNEAGALGACEFAMQMLAA